MRTRGVAAGVCDGTALDLRFGGMAGRMPPGDDRSFFFVTKGLFGRATVCDHSHSGTIGSVANRETGVGFNASHHDRFPLHRSRNTSATNLGRRTDAHHLPQWAVLFIATVLPIPASQGHRQSVDPMNSKEKAMIAMSRGQVDMVRAFFANEFDVVTLDRESIPEVSADAVAEWVDALAMSGLFLRAELDMFAGAWTAEPEAVIALLVGDIDEISAKRHEAHQPATAAVASPALVRAFGRAS